MKNILVAIVLLIASSVFAGSITIDGTGSESGYCRTQDFSFCSILLKDRSKSSAERDVQFRCELSRGKLETFGLYCTSDCYPSMPGYGSDLTYVNCRTQCRGRCEIP